MKSGNFENREVSTGKGFSGWAHKTIALLLLCSVVLFVPLVLDVSGAQSVATAGDTTPPVGTVWTWGSNSYGQIGDGTTTDRFTPFELSGLDNAVAMAGGFFHTAALKSDGTVWTWGYNSYGQLGDGTTTTSLTPVWVAGVDDVVAIAAGYYHTVALKSDGTVWTWGYNGTGQLGDGTTTDRLTPVQVAGVDNVVAVAGGGFHTIALKSDGTVWTWGQNSYGQLGDGTTTISFTPVWVAGVDNVVAIAAGYYHTVALKSDGTVWAWGYNGKGELGDGTSTHRSTPVQVSGLNDAVTIASGGYHTIALTGDNVPAIIINSGADFTNSSSVTLTLICPNTGADCSYMQFSNDNSDWSTPEVFSTSTEWTLIPGDGTKTVYVKFQDTAGIWSSAFSDTIVFDTTPPITTAWPPSSVYNEGLYVTLTCSDGAGSGCDKIYYTLSGLTPTTSSTVYSGSLYISSNTTLKFFAVDRLGNMEAVRTEVYTIGSTPPTLPLPPTGSVLINGNAAFTNSTSVTLTLNAQAAGVYCVLVYPNMCGVTEMMFSNDGLTWTAPEPATTSKQWTLTSVDGSKTVSVKFRGTAGSWSGAFRDTIILDTASPTTTASPSGGLYNGGVSVTLLCDDGTGSGCDKIYYTVDGSTPTTSSPVYTTPVTISSNTTLKFFAVDRLGNMGAVRTEVYTIDSTPPTLPPTGSVVINGNAAFTNSASVTLTLNALKSGCYPLLYPAMCLVTEMMFSNDGLTWTGAEPATTSKQWTLASGEGTKTVYVKFKDTAGNWSGGFSDTIVLDTATPTTTASPSGGLYNGGVSVTLLCADGTGSGCNKIHYTVDGSTPSTSSPVYTAPVTVPSNTTLKFFAKDTAGNQEPVKTQVYTIDAEPATGSVVINSGAELTNSLSVVLTPSCTDSGSGCAEMKFSNDNTNWTTPEAYATTKAWTLLSGEGTKTVYVKFKDTAGNWSGAFSDTISLDTATPTTFASPSGGLYNGGVSVTLLCADGAGSGCDKIHYTIDGSTPTTSSPVYTAPVTISSNTTLNFFSRDVAGNQEPVKTEVYTIDAEPATGSVVINSGAEITNSVSVVLALSCADSGSGCAEMQFSNDNTNWTTPEAYATTKAWTLLSGDGSKAVFARFKDNAGNWSTTFDDSILLSTAKSDLRISSLAAPAAGSAGTTINVTDTTWNAGPGMAAPSTTKFYLSNDTSFSTRDVLLGSRSVQALSAGASTAGTTAVTIPRTTEAGYYYILAVSDADDAVSEINESNNTRYRLIRIRR